MGLPSDPFGSYIRPLRYWLLGLGLENTGAMQFAIGMKTPHRFLFSPIIFGVWTVASVLARFSLRLLRIPFLSLGVVIGVVGGRVLTVWWSVALLLIAHGNPGAGHRVGYTNGPARR